MSRIDDILDQVGLSVVDVVELLVVDVFFEDVMLDMVPESKPLTRKELYVKLAELRTKLSKLFGVEE